MQSPTDTLSERIRSLETTEPPVIYETGTGAVSVPPTQLEISTAFNKTAAEARDGWAGILYDAMAGNAWLCVSENDAWCILANSGGVLMPHNLLSATHSDTVASVVSVGDVIIGTAGGWDNLAVSVPAANVRNVLGLDNGDTVPAWKTALDATNPAAITVGSAGGPGTSLIFSHRDHIHPTPATWTPSAHNFLSASHSDTSASAASVGAVVVGAGTPALWTSLAVSVPAANVRNVFGVDNGETGPSWKTALDAIAPTTIAEGAAASAGTSLIFSHRDHTHGAPAFWTPSPHNLLSSEHKDTLADSVAVGDIIVGNATPGWARLARSVPVANVRNVLGLDNGDTVPAWKTALDATNPTAIIQGASGSPGTSLIFSHRDHTHASPLTWAPTAHRLLSGEHSDTLADSVAVGDIIVGNATPEWARLARSVPVANVRNVLGLDNGDTVPAWKTALDATNPATLAAGTAAAPGTSLVFSHRDHIHPITTTTANASSTIVSTDANGYVRGLSFGVGVNPTGASEIVGTTGWTIYGGLNANDDLVIQGTKHATKTTSYVTIQPSGGLVGIGVTTPSTKFHVVATSDLFRIGYDLTNYTNINVTSGGNLGIIPTGGTSAFTSSDAGTTNVTETLQLGHITSGTPAAGFGVRQAYYLDDNGAEGIIFAKTDIILVTATHASRKARQTFSIYDTAERECIRIEASGTAGMIGFLGAAAVARQAHITDADGTLASATSRINAILVALENYGLLATA